MSIFVTGSVVQYQPSDPHLVEIASISAHDTCRLGFFYWFDTSISSF